MEEYYKQRPHNCNVRRFYRSFFIYLSVCGILTALNIYTSPGHLWVVWIWGMWGIGILCQGIFALMPEQEIRHETGTAIRQYHTSGYTARAYRRRAFLCHAVTYALSISVFAWILPENAWILPALGWGVGLAIHAVNTFFDIEPVREH